MNSAKQPQFFDKCAVSLAVKAPTPWTVRVEPRGQGSVAVFAVGVQSFELARDDGSEPQHPHMIAMMFVLAMRAAGAPEPAEEVAPWPRSA